MKNIKLTTALLFLTLAFAVGAGAQTMDPDYPYLTNLLSTDMRNFVRTYVPAMPTTDETLISLPNQSDLNCTVKTQYFDGLGRSLQDVQRNAFPCGAPIREMDLVVQHTYDEIGRPSANYLPFAIGETSPGNMGKLKVNPYSSHSALYTTLYPGDPSYSLTQYDNSPLNRVVKTLPPGNSWIGSNLGPSYVYDVNGAMVGTMAASFQVFLFTIGYSSVMGDNLPVNQGTYGYDQITTVTTYDENNNYNVEFKNKKGQTIASMNTTDFSTAAAFSDWYQYYNITYYVYDDLDRLRFVIPPEAYTQMMQGSGVMTSDIANGLCYEYLYDERGREIEKKIPGKDVEYTIYDRSDRPVLIQDGNDRLIWKWKYTRYDALGRPLETGLFEPGMAYDRATLQYQVASGILYPGDLLYYLQTPLFNNYDIPYNATPLSQFWYDDYSNPELHSWMPNYDPSYTSLMTVDAAYSEAVSVTQQTRGLLMGSMVKVLDPDLKLNPVCNAYSYPWLHTVNYYDIKDRIQQIHSDHLMNGINTTTNQYNFDGGLASTIFNSTNTMVLGSGVASPSAFSNTSIITSNQIDHQNGQLICVKQSVNGQPAEIIKKFFFDGIGRVSNKNVSIADNRYTYNIRGWLTGINEAYFDNTVAGGVYFCEKLLYDQLTTGISSDNDLLGSLSANYNGNISASIWKGHLSSPKRAYVYKYDRLNRVTDATFSQLAYNGGVSPSTLWEHDDVDYSMSGVTYDNNGNIKTMNQMGEGPGGSAPVVMDQLTYKYISHTNQLAGVNDGATIATTNPDFKDDASGSYSDYQYDPNGNLQFDNNKSISSIEYNCQNKPTHISVTDKGDIYYIYDAAGNKLEKVVDEASGTQTVTDYVGPFQYTNDVLGNIAHAEGRTRPFVNADGSVGYLYDYFIKDHLENVRSVVTAIAYDPGSTVLVDATGNPLTPSGPVIKDPGGYNPVQTNYIATHEIAQANVEQQVFSNIENVRADKAASIDANDTKAATLDGTDPTKQIGTSLMMRVMPGDQFAVSAESYYDSIGDTVACDPTNLLSALYYTLAGGSAYAGVPVADLPSNQATLKTAFGNPSFVQYYNQIVQDNYDPQLPPAFLNYIVFDEKLQMVPQESRMIQIGGAAGSWNWLGTLENISVAHSGYVLVFISSSSSSPVSFDHVAFNFYHGHELEEDHYYPFGLNIETASADPALANNVKYNSKELQHKEFTDIAGNKSGLEFYDYGARMQDPQIGRWNGIDEKAEKYQSRSPYSYCANNPVIFKDIDGRDFVWFDKYGTEVNRFKSKEFFKTYVGSEDDGWKEAQMPKVIQSRGDEVTTGPQYQVNDYRIAVSTFIFNAQKNDGTLQLYTDGGDKIPQSENKQIPDLDPTLLKAQIIQESNQANITDVLQTNNPGDWANSKRNYGLQKGKGADLITSINTGIKMLAGKGFNKGITYDKATGKQTYTFQGWKSALKSYNGNGVKNYDDKVTNMADLAKAAQPSNY